MILAAFKLRQSDDEERRPSRRLFVLSVLYLGSLFAALVVDAVLRVRSP
jgi:heme O synthase-like polyprenyltransferase